MRMLTEEFVSSIMPMQLQELSNYIMRKKDIKICRKLKSMRSAAASCDSTSA